MTPALPPDRLDLHRSLRQQLAEAQQETEWLTREVERLETGTAARGEAGIGCGVTLVVALLIALKMGNTSGREQWLTLFGVLALVVTTGIALSLVPLTNRPHRAGEAVRKLSAARGKVAELKSRLAALDEG